MQQHEEVIIANTIRSRLFGMVIVITATVAGPVGAQIDIPGAREVGSFLRRANRISLPRNGLYDYSITSRETWAFELSVRPFRRWSLMGRPATIGITVGSLYESSPIFTSYTVFSSQDRQIEIRDKFVAAELLRRLPSEGATVVYFGLGFGSRKRSDRRYEPGTGGELISVTHTAETGPRGYIGIRTSAIHLGADVQVGLVSNRNGPQPYLRLGTSLEADRDDKIVNRLLGTVGLGYVAYTLYVIALQANS